MTMKLFSRLYVYYIQNAISSMVTSCLLAMEMVDVELKVKTMQGIHTFRQDRISQVIKHNPWSTRLHLFPSLVRKMKTYLELEGKLDSKAQAPIPNPAITKPSTADPATTSPTKHQTQD